jgi:hypothetical protein
MFVWMMGKYNETKGSGREELLLHSFFRIPLFHAASQKVLQAIVF